MQNQDFFIQKKSAHQEHTSLHARTKMRRVTLPITFLLIVY